MPALASNTHYRMVILYSVDSHPENGFEFRAHYIIVETQRNWRLTWGHQSILRLPDRQLSASDELIEDVRLLLFSLKVGTTCLKLQQRYFLIVSIRANAHLEYGFRKPNVGRLYHSSNGSVGIIGPCCERLPGQFEHRVLCSNVSSRFQRRYAWFSPMSKTLVRHNHNCSSFCVLEPA